MVADLLKDGALTERDGITVPEMPDGVGFSHGLADAHTGVHEGRHLASARGAHVRDLQVVPSRIAFGPCARQNKPQPILDVIVDQNPELMVYLGTTSTSTPSVSGPVEVPSTAQQARISSASGCNPNRGHLG